MVLKDAGLDLLYLTIRPPRLLFSPCKEIHFNVLKDQWQPNLFELYLAYHLPASITGLYDSERVLPSLLLLFGGWGRREQGVPGHRPFYLQVVSAFLLIRSQVLGIQSDVLFPVTQQRELETLLKEAGKEGININYNLKQDLLYHLCYTHLKKEDLSFIAHNIRCSG